MRAITILCQSPNATRIEPQLSDLLELAGSRARSAEWRVSGVEAIGPQSDLLHSASDSGDVLNGVRFWRPLRKWTRSSMVGSSRMIRDRGIPG